MQRGEKYIIHFPAFTGPLRRDGAGLYLSSYQDGDKTVYLATTQFEAPYARKAFPCFDEPALKATFDITLLRRNNTDRNYISLSNTDVIDSKFEGAGWVADRFNKTPVMPTYLLAFIVCDYLYWENITTTRYRTYARPNAVQFAGMAQDYGVQIFDQLEHHFDPDYPISKLDHIAIPDFNAGAMENWGLVTYRETLLYEPGVSSASDKDWAAEVIAHEIAHMWFGNIVSPQWWDWLWLNEAFASFWDWHTVHELFPDWRTEDMYVVQDMHGIFESDALKTSHPLTADVMTPAEISSIFDSVTYSKGAGIVRMMHTAMGQEDLIKGLNIYLIANQYGNAVHQDLWDGLDKQLADVNRPFNMTYLMDCWVTQMNYPVVHVSRPSDHTIHVTQSRFLIGSPDADDTAPYNYRWNIPISITSNEDLNFARSYEYENVPVWLHYTQNSVSYYNATLIPANNPTSWIIVNVRQHGYFRVNYDSENWNALINQLNSNHEVINAINRGQIINDAWSLVKAGKLDMQTALRTLDYLGNEIDYVPWRAFSREMGFVETMLERTSAFQQFGRFIQEAVSSPMQQLGRNITEEMKPIDVFVRTLLTSFACRYDERECVMDARDAFNAWKTNPSDRINPNLQNTFYCTAVRWGTQDDWEFVYQHYKNETASSPKSRLRYSLSCTREPHLLSRVLEMAMDETEVRPQDIRTTIQYVSQSRWGRDIAWDFFKDNFDRLKKSMSTSSMSRLIATVTESFNTDYRRQQIEEFMNSGNNDITGLESAFKRAIEQTNSNKEWMDRNYNIIKEWLDTKP